MIDLSLVLEMVAISLIQRTIADSIENCGKSQNKLLEAPAHEHTCFSAQDPVF